MRVLLRIYQIAGLVCLLAYVYFLLNGENKLLLLATPLILNPIVGHLIPDKDNNGISYRYSSAFEKSKKYLSSPVFVDEYIEETGLTDEEVKAQINEGNLSAYQYDEFLFIEKNE